MTGWSQTGQGRSEALEAGNAHDVSKRMQRSRALARLFICPDLVQPEPAIVGRGRYCAGGSGWRAVESGRRNGRREREDTEDRQRRAGV